MGNRNSRANNPMMPCEVFNLHIAVMQNDARAVKQLANLGVNLNHPWNNVKYPSVKDGTTALCEAISLNHKPVVEVLLEMGTNINQCDSFGYTPLHKAAYHTRVDLVSLLIKKGANVNSVDRDGNTPLHTFCKVGLIQSPASVRLLTMVLLDAGASPSKRNKLGRTPLHIAAEWGLPHLIEILLKAGADMDAIDNCYRTPLHCCVETLLRARSLRSLDPSGFLGAVNVLLRAGCDPLNISGRFLSRAPASHPGVGCYRTSLTHSSVHGPGPKVAATMGTILLTHPGIVEWAQRSAPHTLKHQCRIYIRSRLNMTQDKLIKTVPRFAIPHSLKEYLLRIPI